MKVIYFYYKKKGKKFHAQIGERLFCPKRKERKIIAREDDEPIGIIVQLSDGENLCKICCDNLYKSKLI